MFFGNDQRMAFAYGKLIEDGKGCGRFQNEFTFFLRVAERAFCMGIPGDLVIVLVRVNLAVFIFKDGGNGRDRKSTSTGFNLQKLKKLKAGRLHA